ncbi:MAG: hypothetical protein ABEI52_04110, partial [Halobacteriaceae archaeon]
MISRSEVIDEKWVSQKTRDVFSGDTLRLLMERWDFFDWMLKKGKNPEMGKSLSWSCAKDYIQRLDQLQRIVWRRTPSESRYLTHDQADQITDWLCEDTITTQTGDPYSDTSKRKFQNALVTYFQWRADRDDINEWLPERGKKFSDGDYERSYDFNLAERKRLREAAREYQTHPDPDEVSPKRRDRIRAQLAQRLGKPKDEISERDWTHEGNGAKIPSLVGVALDSGIPPIEVRKAQCSWVDLEEGTLTVPEEAASKGREEYDIPLTGITLEDLEAWLEERNSYDKYADTDALWLNADGNPYEQKTLNDLLRNLCDV